MSKKGNKFQKYSVELKIKAVTDYLDGNGGYKYIAKKYGLKNHRQVYDWVKIYKGKGKEGFLVETRGRNSKGRPKAVKLEEMSLEQQVEYLKMENDILKKVQALLKD